MKIRSLVGLIVTLVFVFGYMGDSLAYAKTRSSRSYSSKSYSTKSYSSKSYSTKSKTKSYSSKPKTYSAPKKSTIDTKKKSTIDLKKRSTVSGKSKTVTTSKPFTSTIKTKPTATSHYSKGHKVYKSGGSSVIFINADGSDCDYDDMLEGDDDCSAFYADSPDTQVKSVTVQKQSQPSAGLVVFRWIMGILFFGILIAVILLIISRMRKF